MRYRYSAVILAIKNDFCVEETILELKSQGVSHVLIVSPETYWSDGSFQNENDLSELHGIAERTGSEIMSERVRLGDKQYHALFAESTYRNIAVQYLEEQGKTDFVLTVDSDELWAPGALKDIDNLAEDEANVCLPGIPVIGIPGLPVEGASDAILVASWIHNRFNWGRSVDGKRIKGSVPVYHFSSTRRTLQEVADKCRKSAHYDDPTYDFEGWIKNVLPNVTEGMRDVHMYKSPVNIWPKVRSWTPDELNNIPKSLHPYLKIT